ncbi:hypothetical protein L21SP5_00701 [Salinivirga cyanobacteriivorans]|uniref:DUF3157 domain-containing protein n=1 Tax=Salinivirga cyanobacteriivorans TaxID=1307839 RepID=A0A0S2HWP1_9BACT|nr:hypothetical protein [Salinivirga cyanobacteriivorans]ALO14373.1 hypothetical protein L21SP5_00701 [Salinivirga cyanobacteriivorans]
MKRITFLVFCLMIAGFSQAQQRAVTETGDEVILFEDGTWQYQDEDYQEEKEIPTNPTEFEKDKKSTFLLKSNRFNVGIYLNPKVWSFKKAIDNPDAEYQFQLKDGDLYGMVITEKVEIPLETLKTIALENGKAAAPDLKIVQEEYRTVNGLKVLLLQMNGTTQGIKFSYYGYYYSNTNGTIQFMTYTSQNLLDSYRAECDKLLNGLVEIN